MANDNLQFDIEAFNRRDRETTLNQLYIHYFAEVRALCHIRFNDPSGMNVDADEAAHAAIENLAKTQTQFNTSEEIRYYLIRAAINECNRVLKQRHSLLYLDPLHETLSRSREQEQETDLLKVEMLHGLKVEFLKDCLKKLPLKQRQIILSQYFDNRSPSDIAESMGLNADYIHKQKYKAIQSIKKLFNKRKSDLLTLAGIALLLSHKVFTFFFPHWGRF